MFSLLKPQHWSFLGTHGLIQINTTYLTERKPLSSVLLRIAALFVMLAVATVLITPPLMLVMPAWKATIAMIGIVMIYLGGSFFIRPQADSEKQGWQAGATQSESAIFHRVLVLLHWLLAPGQFAAETVLDFCVLLGLVSGAELRQTAVQSATTLTPALEASIYSLSTRTPEQPHHGATQTAGDGE